MTLRFNLDFLELVSKGDPKLLRLILKHYYRNDPMNIRYRHTNYNKHKMFGRSFILNPEPIVYDNLTDPSYVAQYIRLAARRSFMFYTVYNTTYLDLSSYPDINISTISHNPLLSIADNKINFKHEKI